MPLTSVRSLTPYSFVMSKNSDDDSDTDRVPQPGDEDYDPIFHGPKL